MKFYLEAKSTFQENLIFWIQKYLRLKTITLSNRFVKDKEKFNEYLNELDGEIESIEKLHKIMRNIRNMGIMISAYIYPLINLFHFLEKRNLQSLKEIDDLILIDFLTIYTNSLSVKTRQAYRMVLIDFFNFINKNQDSKIFFFEITLKINDLVKENKKLPVFLDENEIYNFLEELEKYASKEVKHNVNKRNVLLLKIIIFTGMRVSEALGLRISDINEKDNFLTFNIKCKGGKNRIILTKKENIINDLEVWLKIRKKQKNNHSFIFSSINGKIVSQATIYEVVKKILCKAKIIKSKMGAHMLRHSFATLLYQKYNDLLLVQEALGHSSLETTRIYTHLNNEKKILIANLFDNKKLKNDTIKRKNKVKN